MHASAPHGHRQTTTLISSIWFNGTTAVLAIGAPTDTEVFATYVRCVLRPSLRAGDIVIMDSLRPHKNEGTLAWIATAGATVLFLPAYSPDLKRW